jgi:hypothetical protein
VVDLRERRQKRSKIHIDPTGENLGQSFDRSAERKMLGLTRTITEPFPDDMR